MGDYPGHDFSGYTFNCRGETASSNFDDCKMMSANGVGIKFGRSTFRNAEMSSCNMSKADMSSCDFCNARMEGGRFTSTNFRNADFTSADLSNASLGRSNLTGASFTLTRVKGADLSGANLTDARFSSVDLSHAKGLAQAQLDSAKGDLDTILPEGLTRPAHWQ